MTSIEWDRIKALFEAALRLPESERLSFLSLQTDPAVIVDEVQSLLTTYESSPEFLEGSSPKLPPCDPLPDVAPSLAGRRIGAWQLIRVIGRGGMGTVWEARRADEQYEQRAAMKLLPVSFPSEQAIARFREERQILAKLSHPHIARLLDGGTLEDGSPYLVMEYIEGPALDVWCEEQQLNLRARLQLFLSVCAAVEYAHRHLVVHRDLKPANILVTADGAPKLLDFGIAKLIGPNGTPGHATTRLLTPEFASPEQLRGDVVTTSSNVFSLGVLLYVLLAGRKPFTAPEGDALAVMRAICEEEPPLPSAAASGHGRELRGELDAIILQALRKDPEERYYSVRAMADDLQAWLDGMNVSAVRPSWWRRSAKFVRRHKTQSAAVTLAVVFLLTGSGISWWQMNVARRERDWATAARQATQRERDRAVSAERAATQERNRAEAEKQHAETESAAAQAISDFLQKDLLNQASVIAQVGPGERPGPDLKVRTALDRAAARIAGRFDRQPLVEAAIRHTIADTYWDLGLYPEAQTQGERALDLRRRALGNEHHDTQETMLLLARVYRDLGKYQSAEPLLAGVVGAWRRSLGERNAETLSALNELATLYEREGKYSQAEPIAVRVLEQRRRILGLEHRSTLESMNDLGALYVLEGKYANGQSLLKKSLEVYRRVNGEQDPDTLVTAHNLTNLYMQERKYPLAEPLLRQVLEADRRVFGEESPHTVTAMSTLAQLDRQVGKYEEAETLSLKVLEIRRRVLGAEHVETLKAVNNLAVLYSSQGKYADSEPLLTSVLDGSRHLYGKEHRTTLTARYNLASAYYGEGKFALAEPLLIDNIGIARRVLSEEHPETLTNVLRLGLVYQQQARYTKAEPLHTRVLEVRQRVLGPEHPETVVAMVNLAALYQEEGKYSEAEPLLTKGLEMGRRVLGSLHPTIGNCLTSLAKLRLVQHRYVDAEALLRDAVNVRLMPGPYTWEPFDRQSLLGLSLMEQSKFAEAEPLLVSGYNGLVRRKSVVPKAVSLREAGERIVQLYTIWGKPDKAAEWRQQVQVAGVGTAGPK